MSRKNSNNELYNKSIIDPSEINEVNYCSDNEINNFLLLPSTEQESQLNSNISILSKVDTSTGNTILHLSVKAENYPLTKSLIEKGADVNIPNNLKQIPLHLAIQIGNHKLINLLLENQSDPNAKDINGDTPTHLATYNGDYKVIRLLLLFKANISLRNNNNILPINFAIEKDSKKCYEVLSKALLNSPNQNVPQDKSLTIENKYCSISPIFSKNKIKNINLNSNNSALGDYMISRTSRQRGRFLLRNLHSQLISPNDSSLLYQQNTSIISNQNKTFIDGSNGMFLSESPQKLKIKLFQESKCNNILTNGELSIKNCLTPIFEKEKPYIKKRLYTKKVIGRNHSKKHLEINNKDEYKTCNNITGSTNTNTINTTPYNSNNNEQNKDNNKIKGKVKFDDIINANLNIYTEQEQESLIISHSNINNNFPWMGNENGNIGCKIENKNKLVNVPYKIINSNTEIFIDGFVCNIIKSKQNGIKEIYEEHLSLKASTQFIHKNNTLRLSKTKDSKPIQNYIEEIDNFVQITSKDNDTISDEGEVFDTSEDDILEIVEPSLPSNSTKEQKLNININTPKSKGSMILKGELYKFLKEIDMDQYTNMFYNEGFDDIQMIKNQMKRGFGITDSNLKELGIKKAGDRARILIRLQEISKSFSFNFPSNAVYYYNRKQFIQGKYDFHVKAMINWLKEIKMEKYIENFYNNGYHSMELLYIQMFSMNPFNEDILEKDIGVDKIGYRIRILNKLRDDGKKYVDTLKKNNIEFTNIKNSNNASCKCVIF